MCLVEDSDGWTTVLTKRQPRARVPHRCAECGRTIQPGERYLAESTVFDGEFENHKTCSHCQVARAWLNRECNGFLYHGIGEDIAEHASGGLYGFGIARLDAGMRRRWTRKDGRLWPIPKMPAGADHKAEAT